MLLITAFNIKNTNLDIFTVKLLSIDLWGFKAVHNVSYDVYYKVNTYHSSYDFMGKTFLNGILTMKILNTYTYFLHGIPLIGE